MTITYVKASAERTPSGFSSTTVPMTIAAGNLVVATTVGGSASRDWTTSDNIVNTDYTMGRRFTGADGIDVQIEFFPNHPGGSATITSQINTSTGSWFFQVQEFAGAKLSDTLGVNDDFQDAANSLQHYSTQPAGVTIAANSLSITVARYNANASNGDPGPGYIELQDVASGTWKRYIQYLINGTSALPGHRGPWMQLSNARQGRSVLCEFLDSGGAPPASIVPILDHQARMLS